MFFSKILKIFERYIPTNTNLYVHIMYFNSSKKLKIFRDLEWWAPNAYQALGPRLA